MHLCHVPIIVHCGSEPALGWGKDTRVDHVCQVDFIAPVADQEKPKQTALSGSPFKPPALPGAMAEKSSGSGSENIE
jgi:hypothetical protein